MGGIVTKEQAVSRAQYLDLVYSQFGTLYYFIPPIARHVSMGGVVTEEKAINRAQYLDLVYSQSRNLYYLIPHAPHPTSNPSRPSTDPPIDGILGSIQI